MKPRLLDLFCGAGGAAMGYSRAGFDVVGVDNRPQPRYPFEFVQADALDYVRSEWHLAAPGPERDGAEAESGSTAARLPRSGSKGPTRHFDAIHASPPCQFATAYKRTGLVGDHENLIPATRELLDATGLPYVIENVEDAREHLRDPAMVCGSSLGLDVRRHRLFESNWPLVTPPCAHGWQTPRFPQATNRENQRRTVEVGVWRIPLETQKRAMGVDWDVTLEELSQAIPPAMTELIGHQLMQHVRARSAA